MAAVGSHPHVVRYYLGWLEARLEGLYAYLQMEKCDVSLGTQLAVHGQPFKEAQLLLVLSQVSTVLACLWGEPGHGQNWSAGRLSTDEHGTRRALLAGQHSMCSKLLRRSRRMPPLRGL